MVGRVGEQVITFAKHQRVDAAAILYRVLPRDFPKRS